MKKLDKQLFIQKRKIEDEVGNAEKKLVVWTCINGYVTVKKRFGIVWIIQIIVFNLGWDDFKTMAWSFAWYSNVHNNRLLQILNSKL